MTRKEQLQQEYERKYVNGGFSAPSAPTSAAGRRDPVKGRWMRKVTGALTLLGLVAVCWVVQPWTFLRCKGNGSIGLLGEGEPVSPDAPAVPVEVADAVIEKLVDAHKDYFVPSDAEIAQLYENVHRSTHVQNNAHYREVIDATTFIYSNNYAVVNAFSSWRPLDSARPKELSRVIVCYGGAIVFCRLSSLAVAAGLAGDTTAVKRFLDALEPQDTDAVNFDSVKRLVKKSALAKALASEQIRKKAKSVAAGMVIGILAHEAGHQALGHNDKERRDDNMEISRNQEREADSFASSVISSSPFGEYIFAGTLLWYYALASQESNAKERTHPLSKERFENLVRANPEKAAAMGIVLKN